MLAFGTTAFAADDNLALKKTGIAYTDQSNPNCTAGGKIEHGLDGDTTTRWASPDDESTKVADGKFSGEVYFGVNFGAETSFDKIVIDWETARAKPAADGYVIQTSNDGTKWATVEDAKFDYGMKPEDENKDHSIDTITFDAVKAQYVRVLMYAPKAADKATPSIYEFEVYNTTGGSGTENPGTEKPGPSTPTTGVEFPMAMAVVAVAAAACVVLTKSAKKA